MYPVSYLIGAYYISVNHPTTCMRVNIDEKYVLTQPDSICCRYYQSC